MGNVQSVLSTLSIFHLFISVVFSASFEESVILTPSNPTSSLASVALVPNQYNNLIYKNNQWRCTQDGYSLCTYLTINDECDYKSTIKIGIYGGKIKGDVDLLSVFSYTDNINNNDRFFTILNDWDGAVDAGKGPNGGVFVAPYCTSNDNPSIYYSIYDIFNLLTDRDAKNDLTKNVIRDNPAGGDTGNYELLTSKKVKKTSPIWITLEIDRMNDEVTVSFESGTINPSVSCNLKGAFPKGEILANFFSDHTKSIIGFNQFRIDYTCQNPPTKMPTIQPTTGCELNEVCKIWGDPHITTWDGTLYHFQGQGYFDYVKSCDSSNGIHIPFTISAFHDYCLGTMTCVKEVILSMSNNNIISFPTDGTDPIFKDSGSSAVGSYNYIDDINGETVSYTIRQTYAEISFVTDNGNRVTLNFYYKGHIFKLKTSDCLSGNIGLCGLCGNINNDNGDDFTDCQTLDIINNEGSSNTFTGSPWINTHKFGESCCNAELDSMYLVDGDLDCGNDPEPPTGIDETCLDMASEICKDAYKIHCNDCGNEIEIDNEETKDGKNDGMSESHDNVPISWLESCQFDFCANEECRNSLLDDEYSSLQAIDDRCLDSSISECISNAHGNALLARLF